MLKRLRPVLPDGCVSDLRLDARRAGELDAAEVSAIAAHIANCARCEARARALEQHARALSDLPMPSWQQAGRALAAAPTMAERGSPHAGDSRHRSAHRNKANPPRAATWTAFALAAAALVFMFSSREGSLGTRSKGSASLTFFVKRGELVFEGSEGERVLAHDQLRFRVTPHGQSQLAILSRDGAGTVSVYFGDGSRSRAVDASSTGLALDSAIDLDDTPGTETVYGVFCSAPFDLLPLRTELARTGQLMDRHGCDIATIELHKELAPQ